MSTRFRNIVTDAAELEALIGLPSELVIKKQLAELDDHIQAFVARAPFLLLGTVGKSGMCDVSPRGDVPSAATVLDSRTLAIAERPGNRRADSLRNIIETGRAGLLLLVPGAKRCASTAALACCVTTMSWLPWPSTASNRWWQSASRSRNAISSAPRR